MQQLNRSKQMVRVGLATMYPKRWGYALKAIESIYDQVDQIHVGVNQYAGRRGKTFTIMEDSKIKYYQLDNSTGDAAKFIRCHEIPDGYFLTIDDDLIYPPDYVHNMILKIEDYGRDAVISYHGVLLRKHGDLFKNYYRDRAATYFCYEPLEFDKWVHIGGTGCMGFHHSTLQLEYDKDFPVRNMADVWVAKKCQEWNIPIVCASRPEDYIKLQPMPTKLTIGGDGGLAPKELLEIVNNVKWKINTK